MEGNDFNLLREEERLLDAFDPPPDPPVNPQAPKRKRSKFDPIRREEVASTREKGACIRCHMSKLKCSGEYPCVSCSKASPLRISKRRWMQCLPFSFRDVNIYARDSPCSQNVYNTIMGRSSGCLITNNVQLGFVPESYWNLDFITLDFAQWMSTQQLTPTSTSRVGILSSFNLTRLLSTSTPGDMSQNFRLFVETSSALYNRGFHQEYSSALYDYGFQQEYAGYNLVDLWLIRSFAGNKVLDGLQGVLNNNALSRASLPELKALFLVLFGTIVSVGYSGQMTQSGITETSRLSTHEFVAAQQQLIRILTHYMIEIVDRLHLLDVQLSKNAIIEDAYDQWKQMAAFGWFAADLFWDPFFSVAEYRQEGITKCFLHAHRRGSSYVLSWPNTCTFMTDTSLPAMVKAYEARGDRCQACHGLLATDGSCEQCISWGTLLLAQGAPHFVSMQAYNMDTPAADSDLNPDYTITETPPRESGCIDFKSIDDRVAWLCNCASATNHRQIFLAYGMDHTKYDSWHVSSLAAGNGRPPNLLV